jgi:hypothetical protein
MPPILNTVVGSSRQRFRNRGPSIANAGLHFQNNTIFGIFPRFFDHRGVGLVVPTFPALFCIATGQFGCNFTPIARSIFLDKFTQSCVFLGAPSSFFFVWVAQTGPSLAALGR